MASGQSLPAASLDSQVGLTWAPLRPAQVVAICRSLCSLCCVTPDRTQALADLGYANSNQDSTTIGGHTQSTWRTHLEYPAWVIGEGVPHPYGTPTTLGHTTTKTQSKQLHLIHRNKHREAAKMRRQRNMTQMKEQIKTPEKELNKKETSNLLNVEFKTLVISLLNGLNENLKSIKNIQYPIRNEGDTN